MRPVDCCSEPGGEKDEAQFVEDAPVPHIAMPDSLMSSPLSPALNPAFDEQMIEETMPSLDIEPETEQEDEVTTLQGQTPMKRPGLKKRGKIVAPSAFSSLLTLDDEVFSLQRISRMLAA